LSVRIKLPRALAKIADGQTVVEVEGDSVGQCLEQLAARFPKLKKKLFEKNSALSRILEVYLNGESIYPSDLDTKVKDGDELDTLLRIAGG
jgi:molybdopterin converting factor small subunit